MYKEYIVIEVSNNTTDEQQLRFVAGRCKADLIKEVFDATYEETIDYKDGDIIVVEKDYRKLRQQVAQEVALLKRMYKYYS